MERQIMMRKYLLAGVLTASSIGSLRAQEATGPVAEKVKQEVMQLKLEQDKAFDSTSSGHNIAPEWARRYEADGLVHYTNRLRDKAELLDELTTGKRTIISSKHYDHKFHVYGDGGDGTTVIVTYSVDVTLEVDGKRTHHHSFAVDTFIHQKGQWWCAVHSAHTLSGS
jgi:hypothetical protein